MALKRPFHEGERGHLVAGPGDVALQHLAFMVDRSPEIHHRAVKLDVHFVQVAPPVAEIAHRAHPLSADVAGQHRAEPVPPQPNRLVTYVDAALEEQVLHVPQAEREPHILKHYEADHLGGAVEVAERVLGLARAGHAGAPTLARLLAGALALTAPTRPMIPGSPPRSNISRVSRGNPPAHQPQLAQPCRLEHYDAALALGRLRWDRHCRGPRRQMPRRPEPASRADCAAWTSAPFEIASSISI